MFGYWTTSVFGFRRSLFGSGVVLASAALARASTNKTSITDSEDDANGVKVLRKIESDVDRSGLNIRLYQYQTCPFCCKVRSFLDYFGFSYELVEVNPVTRSQLKFLSDYKKVPVVVSNNAQVLIESSLIISVLSTLLRQEKYSLHEVVDLYPSLSLNDSKKSYPNMYYIMMDGMKLSDEQIQNDPNLWLKKHQNVLIVCYALLFQDFNREEREWRQWVDDVFVHLISPNVYRTLSESFETFKWFDEIGDWKNAFPFWERYLAVYVGALAMYFIGKRLKKRHGIEDERVAIFEACNVWMKALGDRPFLGGNQPNLADLALYGTMNSFTGCQAFREMLENSQIGNWFHKMTEEVKQKKGSVILAKRFS